LRTFVPGIASPAELPDELVAELAHGLTNALSAYADMGFESLNLANARSAAGHGALARVQAT
jgi:hypothetical protein